MASNWPSFINPCKNTQNDSWSCCSLIGHKKTKVLWHQSEARTTPTVWNWSGKTVSPGAPCFVLYFSSPKFFFARYDFPSPLLTAPGSPRMSYSRACEQFHQMISNLCLGPSEFGLHSLHSGAPPKQLAGEFLGEFSTCGEFHNVAACTIKDNVLLLSFLTWCQKWLDLQWFIFNHASRSRY